MTRFGVTGHQRASEETWDWVRGIVTALLREAKDVPVCVTSLAAGADQMMAELVLAAGGRITAVIPSADYESTFNDPKDLQRYRRLVGVATVRTLPFAAPSEEAFFAAGRTVVDECDLLVAIWDGQPARGHGGTADVVAYATEQGRPVRVVWPSGVNRD